MTLATIKRTSPPVIRNGENTAEARRQAGLAADFADAAESSVADAQAAAAEALALVAAVRVGAIGDSIIGGNTVADDFGGGSHSVGTWVFGELAWAQALWPWFESEIWFDDPAAGNFSGMIRGFTGYTAGQVADEAAIIADRAPQVTVVSAGTNGINGGATAAAEMAEIERLCNRFRSIGSKVVLANIRPRGDWAIGSPKHIAKDALNALIAAWCEAGNAELWDVHTAYSDGTGMPAAGRMQVDTVHPSAYGALVAAAPLVEVLKRLIIPRFGNQPRGTQLVLNPAMTSNGGSAGANVTGTVPANWTASSGSDVVGALTGGERTFTMTGNGGSYEETTLVADAVAGAEGDWFQAYADVRLDDWAGWRHPYLSLNGIGTTGVSAVSLSNRGTSYDILALTGDPITLRLLTPPLLLPTGATGVVLQLWTAQDGGEAGSGVLTVERAGVFQVADPQPLHNL